MDLYPFVKKWQSYLVYLFNKYMNMFKCDDVSCYFVEEKDGPHSDCSAELLLAYDKSGKHLIVGIRIFGTFHDKVHSNRVCSFQTSRVVCVLPSNLPFLIILRVLF